MATEAGSARQMLKALGVLVASTTLLAASCFDGTDMLDLWDVGHEFGDRLHAERPECPVMWDSIPLTFDPKQVDSIKLAYGRAPAPGSPALSLLPPGFIEQGSGSNRHIVFTPQNGDVPLSGPITNIPEFNDCQAFLSGDAAEFGALHAIFASFGMRNTMQDLGFVPVVAWKGVPGQLVATVTAAGMATAGGAGVAGDTTSVTAVDSQGNAVGPFTIHVAGSPVNPGTVGPSMAVGPGAPPAILQPNETRQLVLQTGPPTTSVIAAATVFSYGKGYSELGIGAHFNCLYVYFDDSGALRAKMVWVQRLDEYQHACLTAVDPRNARGTDLRIVRSRANLPAAVADYPAVARWDTDPETQKHYIGIMCGDAWCEIGKQDFKRSRAYSLGAVGAAPSAQRVVQVKGWYDEQVLAAPKLNNPRQLRPSGLLGTVIPADTLGQVTKEGLTAPSDDGDPWTLVAYVAIRELATDPDARAFYQREMGLELASMEGLQDLTQLNQMYYCYGSKDSCLVPSGQGKCGGFLDNLFGGNSTRVWVKVVGASSGNSKVFCVTRRGHPAFTGTVPATARWRWVLEDDTIWTACVQGCCQTERGE